jgi:hypothetical protein
MPKIRRRNLPPALLDHLLDRIRSRAATSARFDARPGFQIEGDTAPEVPTGRWFKRFSEITVCGEGELVKTFLRQGQAASGEEVC